ncbi:MAG: energy transducer TonB [bacterium JZ-2024 1]
MPVEMTPGEVRNARWAAVSSLAVHILVFLLMVALQPHLLIGTGTPLNYVRVGLVEIETQSPAPPKTPLKGVAPSDQPSRVQPMTRKESARDLKAEGKGEEGYNPADYPGDREAGARLVSPIVTPKTIQNLGLSGAVTMRVMVAPDATVETVKVTRSSGNTTVDEMAVKIARRLVYEPRIFKGQRVRGEVTLTCRLEPEKTHCETTP